MNRYALLVSPSANRVYARAAAALTIAELGVLGGTLLEGRIGDARPEEIAGVPYVTFDGDLDDDAVAGLANVFVAGFIGSPRMNLLEEKVVDGHATVGDVRIPVPAGENGVPDVVTVGVRPEAFRLVPSWQGGLPMEVLMMEELGADSYVHGFTQIGAERHLLIVRAQERGTVRKGDLVHALPETSRVHLFDTASGARL